MADNSGIKLFEHNETAYISAVRMLKETGKAAVIHPTGTGKSFIAFKLCYDNADKKICWLSPGEYIFKTQCENLAAAGSAVPRNIAFFTYAKLMLMTDAELEEIKPDYIILDEFHRCGAEMWGQGVKRLLNMYSDTPVLGLTATNIRYLDNRRDMADELFNGNIASEMTLGEAIVRGILNPPKYVLSVFGYGNEFKKYEQKVKNTRSKAVRAEGEKYLDALKRALDKADGLDKVFAKHMPKRDGKYIVFCASFDHMNEMADKAKEWFAKVDTEPHIYKAYSNDPATSKVFSAFKADVSKHLKLLYSIDMLNEGIHVDDIDGVILLRPTVSPIIYKQQIGRALSAGKKSNPVIFDIVLNIENLYSIGAVEEEMQIATAYYRSLGEESSIVNDSFSIYDEVKDCRELFSRLNDVLTVSWQTMFEQAKKYYSENGDLEVPARFITNDGYSLGHWIYNQRAVRKGQQTGNLSEEQIEKLNSIGMRWDLYTDYKYAYPAFENSEERINWIQKLEQSCYKVAVLVHPKAYVAHTARLRKGVLIEPMAVIKSNASIGIGSIVSAGAVVGSNTFVGDGCFIGYNSAVSDNTLVPAGTKIPACCRFRLDRELKTDDLFFKGENIIGEYETRPQPHTPDVINGKVYSFEDGF